jgi:hypothetical protein
MTFRRDRNKKEKKKQPRDLASQFRELKRLRIAVAKAEAEISKKRVDDEKSAVTQKP